MPIAKITGQGLAAISFSVALLWGFIIGERTMTEQSRVERARVLREIEHFQRRIQREPVSTPIRPIAHRVRITAG